MPSDLIRGWTPVRVKKTRQNKILRNWNYLRRIPGECEKLRRRNAPIAQEKETPFTREVLPMSEVIPFPPKPPKSIAEETAEFLQLLERIRSSSDKVETEELQAAEE